ncbi:unnamed protein product [Discosporangium mesarthrocarpum]
MWLEAGNNSIGCTRGGGTHDAPQDNMTALSVVCPSLVTVMGFKVSRQVYKRDVSISIESWQQPSRIRHRDSHSGRRSGHVRHMKLKINLIGTTVVFEALCTTVEMGSGPRGSVNRENAAAWGWEREIRCSLSV